MVHLRLIKVKSDTRSYSNSILQKEGTFAQAKSIYASSGSRIVKLNLKLLETNQFMKVVSLFRLEARNKTVRLTHFLHALQFKAAKWKNCLMAGKISCADKWTDKIFCLHLHFRLSPQMGAELDRLQNVRLLLPTCDSYFLSAKIMR